MKNTKITDYFANVIKDEDPMIRDSGIASIIIAFIMTIASFFFMDWWGSLTVFVGSMVMILNFIWLKELVNLLTGRAEKSEDIPRTLVKFLLRYILLGIFLYVIITAREVNVVALLLGLSVLVLGVFIVSIKLLVKGVEK